MLVHCIDRDIKALAALGKTGFRKIMAVTHTGITTDDFLKFVADWITTTISASIAFITELVYQPMIELFGFLRANGFQDLHRLRRRRGVHACLHRARVGL